MFDRKTSSLIAPWCLLPTDTSAKTCPAFRNQYLILTLPGQPEGQDGFLRMTEVMGLKMNCDVAALTACQTGLGRHISGEGTMGMGKGFSVCRCEECIDEPVECGREVFS